MEEMENEPVSRSGEEWGDGLSSDSGAGGGRGDDNGIVGSRSMNARHLIPVSLAHAVESNRAGRSARGRIRSRIRSTRKRRKLIRETNGFNTDVAKRRGTAKING